MADAKAVELVDKLVSLVRTAWNPSGDNTVSREWLAKVADDLPTLKGRKVFFFTGSFSRELENRAQDAGQFQVGAVMLSRYDAEDGPTTAAARAWVDAEVYFVEQMLFDLLDYTGRGNLLKFSGREVLTQSIEVVQLFDADEFDQKGVFRCEVAYVFRELQTR